MVLDVTDSTPNPYFRRLTNGYSCWLIDAQSLFPLLNRWHEGYFLKKISLPSKIFCRLTDALHLTDGKLRCRLTDGFERCRITEDKFSTLKKKS